MATLFQARMAVEAVLPGANVIYKATPTLFEAFEVIQRSKQKEKKAG